MTSTTERLVYMANQIARNLAAQGEKAAVLGTADHIPAFWDPRMRAAILAEKVGLEPIARQAIEVLRLRNSPPHQTPATAVQGGSDAD